MSILWAVLPYVFLLVLEYELSIAMRRLRVLEQAHREKQ